MKVIEQCAPKVESDIKQFLISSVSGDSRFSSSQIDYHEVIYDLYRCAPQTLSGVAPYLTGELLVRCYFGLLPLLWLSNTTMTLEPCISTFVLCLNSHLYPLVVSTHLFE